MGKVYYSEDMIIKICAKCSDMFSAELVGNDKKTMGHYSGYVPHFMPGEHYGDYVQLDIDTVTGQIMNWVPPTRKQLSDVFKFK